MNIYRIIYSLILCFSFLGKYNYCFAEKISFDCSTYFSTETSLSASFSPDGEKIAISAFTHLDPPKGYPCKPNLYLIDKDGLIIRQLTPSHSNDFNPVFSPDGSRIAFMRLEGDSGGKIYIINSDGSGERKLTKDVYLNSFVTESPHLFSPDGAKVVFARIEDLLTPVGTFIINIDGSGERKIYSNDARPLFFLLDKNSVICQSENKIFLLDIIDPASSTGSFKDIVENNIRSPSFSFDGQKIVFLKTRHVRLENGTFFPKSDVYLMNSDGKNSIRVTSNELEKAAPFFSPDGKRIYFFERSGDKFGLWRVNVDGSDLQQTEIKNAKDHLR